MAGSIIQNETGIPAIPHFTIRDRSLLGTQADLLGAHALGLRYILATTGDGPKHGPYESSGVYDYDVRELISIIKDLNDGQDANGEEIEGHTDFVVSATASPANKNLDTEIKRMERKVEAGADFFQTQAMYDAEQTEDFLRQAKHRIDKPILIGIMPLKSVAMAGFVNDNIDGIYIPDAILKEMEQGKEGYEIACDFIQQACKKADGLHIFGMGDIEVTNRIVQFTKTLL